VLSGRPLAVSHFFLALKLLGAPCAPRSQNLNLGVFREHMVRFRGASQNSVLGSGPDLADPLFQRAQGALSEPSE
jgi:hypothetical protein